MLDFRAENMWFLKTVFLIIYSLPIGYPGEVTMGKLRSYNPQKDETITNHVRILGTCGAAVEDLLPIGPLNMANLPSDELT